MPANKSMKILVISFAGIGDSLLATPLLNELRLNFPQATLDVLVRWAGARDLLKGNPHVNTVYQQDLIKAGPVRSLKFLWQLRRREYDVSINTYPQSKIQYRMVTRLINAAQRLSHLYHNSSYLDGWLVNRTIPQDYQLHSVFNNLNLVKLLGAKPMSSQHDPQLFLSPDEIKWAENFVTTSHWLEKRIVGIHVGSGTTKNLALRRWPLENYIELTKMLVSRHANAAILLFGGPEEKSDHQTILAQTHNPLVKEAITQDFRQAAALLRHCHAFLSVDTALMHLAATVKVPNQIVIETPTFNKTIEPFNRPYLLVNNPIVHGKNFEYYRYDGRGIRGSPEELRKCMQSITPEAVFQTLDKALV